MTDLNEAFCFFLRKGLGCKSQNRIVDVALTRQVWIELFRMAHMQAVSGIFFDGVVCTALRPDRDLWEQWVAHVLYLEQMNGRIACRGNEWIKTLADAGIRAYVFKGSSVAEWYPLPSHRSFGDIDIVVENGWERLEGLLQSHKISYRNERGDLVVEEKGLTAIEFHPRCEYLYNPVTDARLQALLQGGQSPELYLVCLIVHLRRHFLTYGIGLKQVCDVAVMLRHASLNQQRLAYMLHRLRLEKFCGVLFGFIDTYLGGSDEYPVPVTFSDRNFDLMRKVIFGEGYLLKHSQVREGEKGRFPFVRIVKHLIFWIKRCLKLGGMMPDEACWFLWHQAMWRMKREK